MQTNKNIDYNLEIESFYNSLNQTRKKCFGLQINQKTDDCIDFAPFLRHTLNNVGDPFTGKGGHLQTFKYERELVRLMAKKLHLDTQDVWGYYLSGSSLSNLHAVHVAGKKLGDDVTLVTSEDAHNSVTKAANITRIDKVKGKRLISCLKNYQRLWDSKSRMFKDTPSHDWTSHAADAFRYHSLDDKDSEAIRKRKISTPIFANSEYNEFN